MESKKNTFVLEHVSVVIALFERLFLCFAENVDPVHSKDNLDHEIEFCDVEIG